MKALILWHEYDGGGRITNSSSSIFKGTVEELDSLLKEAGKKNDAERTTKGIIVPHQIIILK